MKTNKVVGRREESGILDSLYKSPKSEFLAVYGRRRVGKTFLLVNFLKEKRGVFFYVSGMKGHSLSEQIEEFTKQMSKTFYNDAPLAKFKRWIDAFEALTQAITTIPKNKKVVLFFDEFPWMATKKSKLLQALDYYWNRYWVNDSRLKLVICGSAASWLIKNVINNKDGLYNRVTRAMEIQPFTLAETKEFLHAYGIDLTDSHILSLYMIFGGIPYYLSMIKKGLSANQCIDQLCFNAAGPLFNEFNNLCSSLFENADTYIALLRLLAKHRYGLGQAEIIKISKLAKGGRVVERLKELEQVGFIASFIPYLNEQKGIYYKVIDEFILFYLNWIEPNQTTIKREKKLKNYWLSLATSPSWISWAGYAFETICHKHIANIRNSLGIPVGTQVGTWRYVPTPGSKENGAQIDLLFDRKDDAITLCEIKYSKEPFVIDKQYAATLLNKKEVYKKHTRTQKQIFIAMISANDIKPTMYSEEIVSGIVTKDDLFSNH